MWGWFIVICVIIKSGFCGVSVVVEFRVIDFVIGVRGVVTGKRSSVVLVIVGFIVIVIGYIIEMKNINININCN